jgi:hypothetical protein
VAYRFRELLVSWQWCGGTPLGTLRFWYGLAARPSGKAPIHRIDVREGDGEFCRDKTKIENSEAEFDYSGWDPESYDGEPPFLAEWQEADEALNLLGQASVSLVQSALKEYLDGCLFVTRSGKPQRKGKESWFDAYQRFFNEQLGVDWTQSPCSSP